MLYKHCKPEHSLPRSEFIRLGTIFDFQKTVEKELVDDGEGTFSFDLI